MTYLHQTQGALLATAITFNLALGCGGVLGCSGGVDGTRNAPADGGADKDGTVRADAGPDGAEGPDGSVGFGVGRRLSVAHNTSCFVRAGSVYCWGANEFGQYGDGSRDESAHPIAALTDYQDAASITLSRWASHVIAADGDLFAAGLDNHEQLPFETTTPMQITAPSAVAHVAGTYRANCYVLASDGALRCRGENTNGEVGDGSDGTATDYVDVGLSGVTSLTAGLDFFCAVSGGDVYCWGSNAKGQMGNDAGGDGLKQTTPQSVDLPANAVEVAAGSAHACARVVGGDVYCWGINWGGQAGSDSDATQCGPHACIRAPQKVDMTNAVALAASDNASCALVDGGTVACWGEGDIATGAALLADVVELASGHESAHFCARTVEGANETVRCWGTNDSTGQLGRGSVINDDAERLTPAPVTLPD